MRFDGKLEKWNDDRGFGFIAPLRGGDPVFVHVSAFPRDGRRPSPGESLTFEVEAAGDGKKRAVNVQRPGHRPPAPSEVRHQRPQGRRRGLPMQGVIVALILVALGGYAYTRFASSASKLRATGPDVTADAPRTLTSDPPAAAFRCDGRTHCSQMTSCEEAKFFLKHCPGTQMDGDRDGIPCESQWCGQR
ncbi:MAG TPA: cold shock domain-containing protein [Burkholderiaceae bacterium]|nr:cold shock domain-containing protein [Burkholderiaceae bacterium]